MDRTLLELIARLEALSACEAMKRTPKPSRGLGAVVPNERVDRNDGVIWTAAWFLLRGLAKVSVIFALKGP